MKATKGQIINITAGEGSGFRRVYSMVASRDFGGVEIIKDFMGSSEFNPDAFYGLDLDSRYDWFLDWCVCAGYMERAGNQVVQWYLDSYSIFEGVKP